MQHRPRAGHLGGTARSGAAGETAPDPAVQVRCRPWPPSGSGQDKCAIRDLGISRELSASRALKPPSKGVGTVLPALRGLGHRFEGAQLGWCRISPEAALAAQVFPKVPAGHVFVLGDNRAGSIDPRIYGSVPLGDLQATVLWPAGR